MSLKIKGDTNGLTCEFYFRERVEVPSAIKPLQFENLIGHVLIVGGISVHNPTRHPGRGKSHYVHKVSVINGDDWRRCHLKEDWN